MGTNKMESLNDSTMSAKKKRKLTTVLQMLLFTIIGGLVIIPFLTIFIASFKPGADIIRYGMNMNIDFGEMSFKNYIFLFTGKHSYFLWFKNSIILTALSVCLTLIICYFVAYGLAMYNFKLKNVLFFLVIATMMVPFEILILPLYQEMIDLGLINTTAGVVVPGICSASTIFFFRQFMISLPKELMDSGRIDGASEYCICVKLMLPITKPAFAAMSILCAMGAWNNMFWPLLIFRDSEKFTLPIGLNTLLTPYGNDYDLLIAGSVFSIIPVFIVFLCFQRFFIEGMTAGAVKG